jgi:hypothetical protein
VVTHVRIAPEGGRLRTYAFCTGDYKPLEGVLERVQAAEGAKLDGRRRGSKQVTMAQIEQVKATRKGSAKKAAAVPA